MRKYHSTMSNLRTHLLAFDAEEPEKPQLAIAS